MIPELSVLYAHRNRDIERIKISFESLKKQKLQNFEVIFVDFGSKDSLVKEIEELEGDYPFVRLFHLPVLQVLWNKSKALNYGITQASGDYIFIADVDLVFHPATTQLLQKIKSPKKFQLFSLSYLDNKESQKLSLKYEFEDLKPHREGKVNGMILTSKACLLQVNGLDEFFHFYGAEDEDLFARLEIVDLKRENCVDKFFYHIWHQGFSGSEDKLLTGNPRMKNIMRINQRHFQSNREKGVIKPLRQEGMGGWIVQEKSRLLDTPSKSFRVYNILAHVEHFLREEIPSQKGEVIKVEFIEDPYYSSWKHKIKKFLGKQTQPYCSMKEVNDMVLKEILYHYRDSNYSFKIEDDLKVITFRIEL